MEKRHCLGAGGGRLERRWGEKEQLEVHDEVTIRSVCVC